MLKLTWIEFLLRTLPEIFAMVWGIHVISRKSIDILKYIFSSVILSILTFFVRWLPIYFGVHMIINMILIISIMVIIRIPIIKSIYSTLLVYFLLTLGEFLNMIMLNLLNIDTSIEFSNPLIKCLVGTPSLIILLLSIIIFNYLLNMKEGTKNVSN
ncbi:hypothetical protein [Clostridium sp.]|uniref:hypothetical protein n=1 Tax=Clostridium sp. TaxID=1506 RepID=UPI00260AC328|nr:hypothetical protein [Clostridium sp.]